MRKDISTNDKDINDLFLKVVDLVTQARERVATAVNIAEVYTKFHIGQYIVEYEQKGETRAEYGKAVLKELSKRLTDRLGDGWSYSTLKTVAGMSTEFLLKSIILYFLLFPPPL